jgi:hypothetical protein
LLPAWAAAHDTNTQHANAIKNRLAVRATLERKLDLSIDVDRVGEGCDRDGNIGLCPAAG